MKAYQFFSTTADVGLKIWGKTYDQLYSNAITGFNALIFGESRIPELVDAHILHRFQYRGDSCENVLVNLLSELIFLMYAENKISLGADIQMAGQKMLDADLLLQPASDEPEIEIKSVTYHNLHIINTKGIKSAEIVFDI